MVQHCCSPSYGSERSTPIVRTRCGIGLRACRPGRTSLRRFHHRRICPPDRQLESIHSARTDLDLMQTAGWLLHLVHVRKQKLADSVDRCSRWQRFNRAMDACESSVSDGFSLRTDHNRTVANKILRAVRPKILIASFSTKFASGSPS